MDASERKQVVVIGNGPSSISLSYLLAGNWPYYQPQNGHPNEELNYRLMEYGENEVNLEGRHTSSVSLVERDLEYLCAGLSGRSINPVSNLFDALEHPDADFGIDMQSTLKWMHKPDKVIDHVVIGEGFPGGAWYKMDDCKETLTVSIANWMQLPNLSIKEWNTENKRTESRASLSSVAKYYKDYVRRQGLEKFFKHQCKVTHVEYNGNECLWEVKGFTADQRFFSYLTPKVVLATGCSDNPNRLNVPGEDLPFVLRSLNELERLLQKKSASEFSEPLLIVGGGLSAADAVIAAKFKGIPIVHVFRKHADDPSLIFNQLPENMYPEYHKVHSRMKGRVLSKCYKPFAMHCVKRISPNREVVIKNLIGEDFTDVSATSVIKVSYVLLLIGMKPDLSFLNHPELRANLPVNPLKPLDCRTNPIKIYPYTHECMEAPGLFALGPLVGDNFVRFLQGGSLAITNHYWSERS